MKNTKDLILLTALELFAQKGYEATSVRDIAAALGLSAGALYRHYPSKEAVFEAILHKMETSDTIKAEDFQMPIEPIEKNPQAYHAVTPQALEAFTLAMFCYWSEDPFAAAFRKMLSMERYRSAAMSKLYHNYLGFGVTGYLADIFKAKGYANPQWLAARYFAPFLFYLSLFDEADDKQAVTQDFQHFIRNFQNDLR